MDNDYRFTTTEEERAARRAQRMAARRQRERERRRKMLLRLLPVLGVVVLAGAAIAWGLHRGESGEGAARAAAPPGFSRGEKKKLEKKGKKNRAKRGPT